MIVVEFPQPAPLMSMNDRQHWRAKARWVAIWRKAAWAGARCDVMPLGSTALPFTVTVCLPVRDKRRRDPHNYYPTVKAIVDGLVDAGVWPDDTPEWVTTTEPRLVVGASVVRVELIERTA